MPRANRFYIPGHIWHLTHRCHNKQFLLQDQEVQQRWIHRLKQTQERYYLPVLGYMVTNNHIHLLVQDTEAKSAIAHTMQYLQGTFAQHYNKYHQRENALWGDRYHATAVEPGDHLLRCLIYIDLNMVRAGVVSNPAQWPHSGYHEIQDAHRREFIIDRHKLASLIGVNSIEALRLAHSKAIEEALACGDQYRDGRWSEAVAIGSRSFIDSFAASLGDRRRNREIVESGKNGTFLVQESIIPYGTIDEMVALEGDNTLEWIGGSSESTEFI